MASKINKEFSPILLAGFLARPLPLAPFNMALKKVVSRLEYKHPAILDRLSPIAGTSFHILPIDLPYVIELHILEHGIDAHVALDFPLDADVKISGNLLSLVEMLDGDVDGDALFFSRDISVEGDTEALLTLRNALDSEYVDLKSEIMNSLGVLKKPFSRILSGTGVLINRLNKDMHSVTEAIINPIYKKCVRLDAKNNNLEGKIKDIETSIKKQQQQIQRLTKKVAAK